MFDTTFIVKVASFVYHEVYDGFIGTRTVIDDAFGTYDEALQYCIENYNSHEVDYSEYDAPYAFITMDVTWEDGRHVYGIERNVDTLTVNSYYTGPEECRCWPEHTATCNFKHNPTMPF